MSNGKQHNKVKRFILVIALALLVSSPVIGLFVVDSQYWILTLNYEIARKSKTIEQFRSRSIALKEVPLPVESVPDNLIITSGSASNDMVAKAFYYGDEFFVVAVNGEGKIVGTYASYE